MKVLILGAAGGIGKTLANDISKFSSDLFLGYNNNIVDSSYKSKKIDATNFDEVENPYHLVSLSPSSYRNDTNKNKIAYVLTIFLMGAIFIGLCWICQKMLFGSGKTPIKKAMKGGGNSESSTSINRNIDQILNSF